MHAGAVVGDRQVLGHPLLGQPRLQVVRVQDGDPRGLLEAVASERADVGVGPHEHAEVPLEAAQLADRARPVEVEVEARPRAVVAVAAHHLRGGQEGLDAVGHRNRPGAGPAAAVRLRERLVQVEVDDVEARVARAHDAHDGVQVRAVVVERGAHVVDDPGDLLDVAVEQPERVRVREHQAGHVLGGLLAQVVEVHPAVRVGAHLDHLVAGHGDRGRVGPVRRVGREHLVAVLAAVLVVGAREQQAGQLALGAGGGLERHVRQAGDLRERALQAPHEVERALRVLGVLERVEPGVPGKRREPLVQLRVVLHRAGAERVEALVQVEVARRERGVVAHDLGLGDLGELRRAPPDRVLGKQVLDRDLRHVELRRREGPAALAGLLEDRDRVLVAARVERVRAHLIASSRRAGAPADTSSASRSMSARVRRSVIATSRPSSYSG